MVNINVVVPCYNGREFIPVFFDSIARLIIPDNLLLHLILVDNGSADDSLTLLKKFSLEQKKIEITVLELCSVKSSYAARNFGANYAKCDYLLFTDIDCFFPDDYFIKLIEFIEEGSSDFVMAGNVLLRLSNMANVFECYDYLLGFNLQAYSREKTGVTANTIVPYNVFLQQGGFDIVESGGDRAFFKRVVNELNVHFIYAEKLYVYHPCRKSYQEILSKARRVGRGQVANYKKYSLIDRQKRFLMTIVSSLVQFHQIKILFSKRKFVLGLNSSKRILLILLVFWLGLYSRMYILVQMISKN